MEKISNITEEVYQKIISIGENDYTDYKAKNIEPKEILRHIIGFANSESGTIYIGIKEIKNKAGKVEGYSKDFFIKIEDAEKFIMLYNEVVPGIEGLEHQFLKLGEEGYILKYIIPKSKDLHHTKEYKYFIRKSSITLPVLGDKIEKIKYLKGISKYEDKVIDYDYNFIINGEYFKTFIDRENLYGNTFNGFDYLKVNNFLDRYNNPRVCTLLGFLDTPQSQIKSSIVINRYGFQKNSRTYNYTRERLEFTKSVKGPIEKLILDSLKIIEDFLIEKKVEYPMVSIKEALVNAVIHREYSIQDDIKIEIFDNQIEITSPGLFVNGDDKINPLSYQRNLRNNRLYFILSKISDFESNISKKLNQDRGEGIKTIFNLARKGNFVDPKYLFENGNTIVVLNFLDIKTYEEKIIAYIEKNVSIANKEAREITGEEDKEKIKNVFKKLESQGIIERLDINAPKMKVRYKLKGKNLNTPQLNLL